MTLPAIINDIIQSVKGGVRSSDSKFKAERIKELVLQYRAIQLGIAYRRESRINPVWTQQYHPDYNLDLQDEVSGSTPVIKFEIPKVLRLDEFTLGFLYIGSSDCLNNYRLLRSRAELATYSKHRVYRKSKNPVCIYSDGILEIHNTELKKIDLRIDSVFENPTELPTYNYDLSQFPIDNDNYTGMKLLVLQGGLQQEAQTPIKQKPTNIDLTAVK